jgi:hypothetical protein
MNHETWTDRLHGRVEIVAFVVQATGLGIVDHVDFSSLFARLVELRA